MDAETRVGRMLDGLMRALEEDNQEWLLYQEGKMVVDVITKAIKPEPLQKAVQMQLQLQRNKPLKSDVFRFVRWLRQFAAGFQVYVGLEEETPKPPKNRTPDPLPKNQGERSKDGKSGGGSGSGKGKPDNPAKPPAGPDAADATKKKRLGCLKCGDENHKVADCPKAAPDEAERLLDAQIKRWKERIKVVGSQSGRRSTGRGATIEVAVRVKDVLLDTGSDVTIVSKGVLDALASAGVAVDVEEKSKPHRVYPYGTNTKPLDMYRLVKFGGVTLDTTCGPLVLRRLQAWVDDSAPHVELIISRQVMESLGFQQMTCWSAL
jgi:hypothetical protein